jgi:hypothetical protein
MAGKGGPETSKGHLPACASLILGDWLGLSTAAHSWDQPHQWNRVLLAEGRGWEQQEGPGAMLPCLGHISVLLSLALMLQE